MIQFTIDGKAVTVSPGSTILEAARSLDLEIPTLCHAPGMKHTSACMVCSVLDTRTGNFLPACTAVAEEGMELDTCGGEVMHQRRSALELLLSEHAGDCEAPCRLACATGMDIPAFLRAVAAGNQKEAATILYSHMAMPATLGHVCDGPCQKACRRGKADGPVEIRTCHRLVGSDGTLPEPLPSTGKTVAVVGAGICGLSAAFFLRLQGHAVALYEKEEQAGGALRAHCEDGTLPQEALEREIARILSTGIQFHTGHTVDTAVLESLQRDTDAVLLTCHLESELEVFRASDKTRPVQTAGEGRRAAEEVSAFLAGTETTPARFNSRLGGLEEDEMQAFMTQVPGTPPGLNTPEQMPATAARCLHCDCRKPETCQLRHWAEVYKARQRRFGPGKHKPVAFKDNHAQILYEPGKCITCGICTQIAAQELPGLALTGRGYDLTIAVPFEEPITLSPATARKCAQECPVGALSLRDAT